MPSLCETPTDSSPALIGRGFTPAQTTSKQSMSASQEDGKKDISILIQDTSRRAMRLKDYEKFYIKNCGEMAFRDADHLEPVLLSTKLVQLCKAQRTLSSGFKAEPNLYSVVDFLIKPATISQKISYAELSWQNEGQPGGLMGNFFFMSHAWAEEFGQSLQSLFRHALSISNSFQCALEQSYWCCAFANNQHQVELGDTLEDSPFYKALTSCACLGTVMNLDLQLLALDRMWCCFETLVTASPKVGKAFVLNTVEGPLTSEFAPPSVEAWASHVNLMLTTYSVTKAQCSVEKDKNMIMQSVDTFEDPISNLKGATALNAFLQRIISSSVIALLARAYDIEGVGIALENKADPNVTDFHGISAVTYLAGNPNRDQRRTFLLEQLLKTGGDIAVAASVLPGAFHCRRLALDADATARSDALRCLGKLGQDASPHLQAIAVCLSDENSSVRRGACLTLYEIGQSAVSLSEKVAQCLGDKDLNVCKAAKKCLCKFEDLGVDLTQYADALAEVDARARFCQMPNLSLCKKLMPLFCLAIVMLLLLVGFLKLLKEIDVL